MSVIERLSRRHVLRGALGGSSVMVALPFLDCFLDGNGTALASGAQLPTSFISWFWGLGLNPGRYEPKQTGALAGQALGPEAAALEAVKDKINVFSMFKVFLDGRPNSPHSVGWQGQLTGRVPAVGEQNKLPTIDAIVADAIGAQSRFRSLELACSGSSRTSVSFRAGGVQQSSEVAPAALYARIFGAGFADPNNADFKPDPAVMVRQSVLSAVRDPRRALMRDLGAADRARLEEYFTSLRQLEQQVALQLQKPPAMEGCVVAKAGVEAPVGDEVDVSLGTHKLMAELIAHALACGQTRVINIALTNPGSTLRRPGDSTDYHTYSHTEPVDPALGYQKNVSYFATRSMEGLATLVQTLDRFKEGDRTLLDRSLVYATSDTGYANTHSMENIPVFTAGRANGAMKTGLHVSINGDPATRIGLTVMQALKLSVGKFGSDSNETSKPVSEVLA